MEIIVTAWALDSYLDLKHRGTFTANDYNQIIRPDVLKLKRYPNDPSFLNGKFWSPATDLGGPIPGDFKMKWHNLGYRLIQLRLPIGMFSNAVLCHAYVKTDSKFEQRQLAKFKTRLELIRRGQYTECGRLI